MMAMVFAFTVSSFQPHNESTMHQFVVAYLTSSLSIVTMISLILIGINPPPPTLPPHTHKKNQLHCDIYNLMWLLISLSMWHAALSAVGFSC